MLSFYVKRVVTWTKTISFFNPMVKV